jgi:CYTH domain-containing protein
VVRKQRWRIEREGQRVAVDVFGGHLEGLVLAEVDRGTAADHGEPAWLDAVAEVTSDDAFTGSALASATRAELAVVIARYGVELADASR